MYSLRLLGGVALEGPSGPLSGPVLQKRSLALLAMLAAAQGNGWSRGKLMAYLWPEHDEAGARHLLANSVYVVRKALGDEAVQASGEYLRLNADIVRMDIADFAAALEEGDLERAVDLYAGPFMDGFHLSGAAEFDQWVESERRRLAGRYEAALESLAEQAEGAGDPAGAVGWWRQAAAHDPYNSRLVLRLMNALAKGGDPANAIQLAREHERFLERELGVEPPADLQAFLEQLRQEPLPPTAGLGEVPARAHEAAPEGQFATVAESHEARRQRRRGVAAVAAAGLVILVLVAGAVVAYMSGDGFPFRPAAGLFQPGERIVLAQFENLTSDPTLAEVVTGCFHIALNQSTAVTIASERYVAGVLARMDRDPDTPLDEDLALEVAIREGLKAYVTGQLTSLGTSYVLSSRLVAAETGEELWSGLETAEDLDAIIPAIDRLSRSLRERIGESLSVIERSQPLGRATTSSLAALRRFTQGMRYRAMADYTSAIRLLEEAVALDTAFALAYRWLDATSTLQGVPRPEALIKAYEHRDRAADWERWDIEARYHMMLGEWEKAIAVYQTWRDIGPVIPAAYINPATFSAQLREYEEAEKLTRQFINIWPQPVRLAYENLFSFQWSQGKFDEARATLERLQELFPEHPRTFRELSRYASYHGDYEAAERHIQTWRENWPADLSYRSQTSQELADLARVRGRAREAERYLRDALAADEEQNKPELYLQTAIDLAEVDLFLRGDADRAVQTVEAALDRYPLDSLPPLRRPYVEEDSGDHEHQGLASFFALAGRPERAKALLTELEREIDPRVWRSNEAYRHRAWGLVALAEGRTEDAVAELRLGDRGICNICVLPYLGLAYEQAGEPDSAIAIFERYLTTPRIYRVLEDALHRARILERLGDLHDQRGDPGKAIHYYGRFVELWQDADPELQPRVEAARRRIAELIAEQS